MRPSNERHPGSERGLQRVCAPLRYVSSGAQSGTNYGNYPNSRIKPDHHMLCRNFVCWLPKIGLLLGIFHAPRTENGLYGYERLGAPSGKEVGEHARKKKKASTDGGQLFTKVALRSNGVHPLFFTTEPLTRLWSRPPDSGFAGVNSLPRHCRHVIHAHLLGFWKLRNFLRPINASMKEAKARRRRRRGRRRRRRSRWREARAELYMHSARSRSTAPGG